MLVADHNGGPSPATVVMPLEITGPSPTNGRVEDRPAGVPVTGARDQSLRALLAVLATGLALGGLVGGLMAGPAGGQPASALVELVAMPDPALVGVDSTAPSPETLAAYVAGEFAQLSGEGFRSAVSQQVGSAEAPDAPRIEVSRIGTSSVVRFSATGATDQAGLKVVQTAVELYGQRRTDEFRAHIEKSIASIDQTLRDIEAPPADRNRIDAGRQARIDRLLTLRADLILQSHRGRALARILAPPAVSPSSPTPPWLLPAVLGALIGGLLALGARALRRSTTTTILTSADAQTVTDCVLYPQVQLSPGWATMGLRLPRPHDRHTSRLLVAQISGPRPLSGRVISVVGASRASASRRVATMIALGAAAQAPTLLVEFKDAESEPSTDAATVSDCPPVTKTGGLVIMQLPTARSDAAARDGWATLHKTISDGRYCVVLDAGTSPEVLRQLPAPVEAVLVVGLGVDSKPQAAALASAIPATTGRLLGVVTRLPWYEQWRAWGRATSHA